MKLCPICTKEPDITRVDLLENLKLREVIALQHPTWTPEQGLCKNCLREFEQLIEEKTVVVSSQHLITQTTPTSEACLIMIHGSDFGKRYGLAKVETIIGRGDTTDIKIQSENISRQHAKIMRLGQDFILEDMDSTNGTFINTKKITQSTLRDGDLILIGNTILKFISGSNIENQYYEDIYKLATIDGLTHAFNKSFFTNRLDEEFSRSRRYKRNLSVILIDLDHFHILNNTYGHIAGDHVLRSLARLISKNLRKEDLFGRFGGEEFVILLPETSHQDVVYLAEKIRKMISDNPFNYDGTNIPVTISLGVCTANENTTTWKDLIEKADEALYKAKSEGRNLVRVY